MEKKINQLKVEEEFSARDVDAILDKCFVGTKLYREWNSKEVSRIQKFD